MYNWVTIRKIARTEGPNYPARAAQTVDAVVAKWIPVTAGLLGCFVTPARAKLDVRYYDWVNPAPISRDVQLVDANVRTWMPAATTEANNAFAVTPARPKLDVRNYEWYLSCPISRDVSLQDANVAKWVPAFANPDDNYWKFTVPPSKVNGEVFRPLLPPSAAGPTVAQTVPVFANPDDSYRLADRPRLDLTRTSFDPDSFAVPADWATWVPFQDTGGLTRARVQRPIDTQPTWPIAVPATPATTAQIWPAILAETQSFLTAKQFQYDVRRFEWASPAFWMPQVVDAVTARQAPAFTWAKGERTAAQLQIPIVTAPTWPATNFVPVPPTVAQTWPAMLQATLGYRTPSAPVLDVRLNDWNWAGWLQPVLDPLVAKQAPTWTWAKGERTAAQVQIPIVTTPTWPTQATIVVPPTVAQTMPAMLETLSSFRTASGPTLDVRQYEWLQQPWTTTAVNNALRQLTPTFTWAKGERTPSGPVLDVRRYDWVNPGWVTRIVDVATARQAPAFTWAKGERTPPTNFRAVITETNTAVGALVVLSPTAVPERFILVAGVPRTVTVTWQARTIIVRDDS